MTSTSENSPVDPDEWLAAALDELSGLMPAAAAKKIEQFAAQKPQLADELQELHATSQIANDVALFQSVAVEHALSGSSDVGHPADPSAFGTQLGDYELREEIGRGGMGVVYRAHQKTLNRVVALKMIPNATFAAEHELARLRGEAQAAARLNHPHIIPVYDVGEHNGQPWFSMQLVEGETLSAKLMNGPMQADEAVALLLPIVDAIEAAHNAGVLHRDIKPSNILIADDGGEPFVTDFGLAKRVPINEESLVLSGSEDGLTMSGAIVGTPSWMSPEQAASDNDVIGPGSDVYSLGALLYAMLTGRPPFQAANPVDTMRMVLEQDPPGVRVLNPAVDSDLEMIVLKCLQKPRDLRYSSAAELASDLAAWQNQDPILARRSTLGSIMTRLLRETHQVHVLKNWGLLWMWHSLVLVALCFVTNAFQFSNVTSRLPYILLWVFGLGVWSFAFWNLRRRAGPITLVERQIAHVWAGSMISSSMLFWVESALGEPVLMFSPMLGSIAGIVFLVKAGMLSGRFYLHAILLFMSSIVMAAMNEAAQPSYAISLFGLICGGAFFFPGLKYWRQWK